LPADSISITDKRVDRLGFGFNTLFFNNNISLNHQNNYLKLTNPFDEHHGWNTDTRVVYNNHLNNNLFNTSIYFRNNDLFLDNTRNHGMELNYSYNNFNEFSIRLRYNDFQRDIYEFNRRSDQSNRGEYNVDLQFEVFLTDYLIWNVQNHSNYRTLNFTENKARNTWFAENDLSYQLGLNGSNSHYFTRLNLVNRTQFTNANEQTTESVEKKFTYGAVWNIAIFDTLGVQISNSIVQNFHSDNLVIMDNDRTTNSYTVFFTNLFHGHFIKNHLQYIIGEQVFISSIMSANIHRRESYLWNTELDLRINDQFRLINHNRIRADYEYFLWTEFLRDRFFRNFYGEWGVRYTMMNTRFFDHLIIYPAYAIENSETAQKIDSLWQRNTSEYQRRYLISINYHKKVFHLMLEPSYRYFNRMFEFELQSDASIIMNDFMLTLNVNPIGRHFNTMIWRVNLNLMYSF